MNIQKILQLVSIYYNFKLRFNAVTMCPLLTQALGVGSEEGGRADQASFVAARRSLKRKGRDKVPIKSREWIVEKKERAKRQGMK